MSENNPEPVVSCINCKWTLPGELISQLLDGSSVFCEKCGYELNKEDYSLALLKRSHIVSNKPVLDKESIKEAGKKLYGKLKTRWKKYKENK